MRPQPHVGDASIGLHLLLDDHLLSGLFYNLVLVILRVRHNVAEKGRHTAETLEVLSNTDKKFLAVSLSSNG
jgi:hypothetical protein